jgi:hypothetical protein
MHPELKFRPETLEAQCRRCITYRTQISLTLRKPRHKSGISTVASAVQAYVSVDPWTREQSASKGRASEYLV